MEKPRSDFPLLAIPGPDRKKKLIAFGGRGSGHTVEEYDPEKGEWSLIEGAETRSELGHCAVLL